MSKILGKRISGPHRLPMGATMVAVALLGAITVGGTGAAELQFQEVGAFLGGWQSLASDEFGNCVVAFVGTIGDDKDILFSVSANNGMTWSDPAPLNSNAVGDSGYDSRVDLVHGQGTWIAAWESKNDLSGLDMDLGGDFDILYSRLVQWDENEVVWSDPAPLNDAAASDNKKSTDYNVHLAANSQGVCFAQWNRLGAGNASGPQLSRSDDDGATWNQLSQEISESLVPGAHGLGEGIAYGPGKWIAFARGADEMGNSVIVMSSSPDGLSWTSLPPVHTYDLGMPVMPALTADDRGNWVLVYHAITYGEPNQIIKTTRSTNNGLDWSVPERLCPNPALDPTIYDASPSVATDGQGNWVAVWGTKGGLGGTLGDDFDLLYSESADDGATWSNPAPVNSNAYTDTVDEAGELHNPPQVAWGRDSWVVSWADSLGVVHVARAAAAPSVPDPGITVEPRFGLYTTEDPDDQDTTFAVSLNSNPTGKVTITVVSDDPLEGSASPGTLTFHPHVDDAPLPPDVWSDPQVVTLQGVDDGLRDGDQPYTVTLSTTISDPDYAGIGLDLMVVNIDNDFPQVFVHEVSYTLVKRNLEVTIVLLDEFESPVTGADVTADLLLNDAPLASYSGETDANGTVTFVRKNAKSGVYTTVVTSVSADGLIWGGDSPDDNLFEK